MDKGFMKNGFVEKTSLCKFMYLSFFTQQFFYTFVNLF